MESLALIDYVAFIFIFTGVIVASIASIGLLRFPDVLSRMHAASKPQTFGLILLMIGISLLAKSWPLAGMLFVVVIAQLMTITAASTMLGRAAFRRGFVSGSSYAIDELTPRLALGQANDLDDDGFVDEDPNFSNSVGMEPGEAIPHNVFRPEVGIELAQPKLYWDEEETDDSSHSNPHPKTGEFQAIKNLLD